MSIKDLFATNKTKAFLTYEARRASSDVEGQISAINLYGQASLYGRVDYAFNAVYPSEAFLKEIEEDIFILNFVADAYEDLKIHYNKLHSLNKLASKNTKLKIIKAFAGWRSLSEAHHKYVKIVFDTFFKTYGKNLSNVSIEEFINTFYRFLKDSKNSLVFTRTSFIESPMYDPLMSGLMIELQEDDKGDDTIKRKYYEDPNFDVYQRVLRIYGFKNDKNNPWRIIADIESAPMLRYMEKYNINNKTLFDEFFYRSYELDMDIIQEYLREYYNLHQSQVINKKPAMITDQRIMFPNSNFDDGAIQITDISKYSDLLEQKQVKTKPVQIINLTSTKKEKESLSGRGFVINGTSPAPIPEPPPDPGPEPPTAFDSFMYLVDVYNPWDNFTEDILAVQAASLTSKVALGARVNSDETKSLLLFNVVNGTVEWTVDNTGLGYVNAYCRGITTDGTNIYAVTNNGDKLQSVAISDGTVNWSVNPAVSTYSNYGGLVYDSVSDKLFGLWADSTNEIHQIEPSTGDNDGDSQDAFSQGASCGVLEDGTYMCYFDETENVRFKAITGGTIAFDDTTDASINFGAAGSLTLKQTVLSPTDTFSYNNRCFRTDRDNNGGVWFVPPFTTTNGGNPFIYHITNDGGPTVDIEYDVSSDTTLQTPDGGEYAPHLCIDKFGRIYVAYCEGYGAGDIGEILVYDNVSGSLTLQWDGNSIRGPKFLGANNILGFDITEDGYLCVGCSTGELYVYKVANWEAPNAQGSYGTTWDLSTSTTLKYAGAQDVGGMERLGDADDEIIMYPYASMGAAGSLLVIDGATLATSHSWDSSTTTYNYNESQNGVVVDRTNSVFYWLYRQALSTYKLQRFDFNLNTTYTGDGLTWAAGGTKTGIALAGTSLWALDSAGSTNDLGQFTSLTSNPPTLNASYNPSGGTLHGAMVANKDGTELFWMDTLALVNINTISGIDGTAEYTYNLATSPSRIWSGEVRPYGVACPINTSAVWLFPGYQTQINTGANSVILLDKDGTKLIEIDPYLSPAMHRAVGSGQILMGPGCVDKNGHVYILTRCSNIAPYHWTVARYDNNGNYITDSWKQGVELNPEQSTARIPTSMTVTGANGYIIIGDDDGNIISIQQAT